MPNTLAHAGLQGLISRTALPAIELRWVYLGVVIPDVPWIFQRLMHVAVPTIDPYLLRSYVVIQASLLGCLVFCAAIALLAKRAWLIFAILGGNAVLHLVLDALQTKWANGAHFWAPFSWELTNWGLFWPEGFVTYGLTVLGLAYIIWYWRPAVQGEWDIALPTVPQFTGVVVLLSAYFVVPILLLQGPIEANAHYLKTLGGDEERRGSYVEIDRAQYVRTDEGAILRYYGGGDQVRVEEIELESPATISIRGIFAEDDEIRVIDYHVHAGGLRNYTSYLGLVLILFVWAAALGRRALRAKKKPFLSEGTQK